MTQMPGLLGLRFLLAPHGDFGLGLGFGLTGAGQGLTFGLGFGEQSLGFGLIGAGQGATFGFLGLRFGEQFLGFCLGLQSLRSVPLRSQLVEELLLPAPSSAPFLFNGLPLA